MSLFTITSHESYRGDDKTAPAALASLRRLLTPERVMLAMMQARGMFVSVHLPDGVTIKPSSYSGTFWAEPIAADVMASRVRPYAEGGLTLEADTLPLRSIHWQMEWTQAMPDGVRVMYRLVVRQAPDYRDGYRPDAGALRLTGELSQTPELPGGLTEAALAAKYRAASLTFRVEPNA